jgi:hypothetical protein
MKLKTLSSLSINVLFCKKGIYLYVLFLNRKQASGLLALII